MSKRPRSESQEEDDAETRSRRCLYLVLDDWKRGYSVHRLGEADFVASRARLDARPAERPLVRVQARHAYTTTFAAHGSKILAMLPERFSPGIPVFDTETLETTVYPFPRSWKAVGASMLVHASVGDRLVSFVFRYLDVLGPEPPPSPSLGPGCKTMPAWKLGKDSLFNEGSIRHSGATLVHMGDSRFCLIESLVLDYNQSLRGLRITSFGLKYDKDGELVTAQYRAYASISYQTVHKNTTTYLDPVAFWM
ncbi:hypothetical protein C2845_PM01G05300 [Panicum miliaceum]|uniref:Uncharacterized protein n=1 Tax=Panicum miliaceum TaxID=4540 RepID=A0A3L6TJP2_PANMI|nr:hypothetical protein C2845_PM01G05300 [Panicum miliaceum]